VDHSQNKDVKHKRLLNESIIDKDETAAFKKVYNLKDNGNFKSQEAEAASLFSIF
jgi:hypothetical protein